MSYDCRLVIDTGGRVPASVTEWLNPTYNLGPMFEAALGSPLYELDGQLAAKAAPVLAQAIASMRLEPGRFEALNPPNGWGTYEDALEFLETFLSHCVAHPKATVKI